MSARGVRGYTNPVCDILGAMTKRLVDIDDEVLAEARAVLGTVTLKDTVNAALETATRVARQRAITREDIAEFVKATEDLRDPEIMAKAWGE